MPQFWLLLVIATLAVGCASQPRSGEFSGPARGVSLDTNQAVWLTREQRAYVSCRDGQALVCEAAGRLAPTFCRCPAPTPLP
jgi:hypothetical protein